MKKIIFLATFITFAAGVVVITSDVAFAKPKNDAKDAKTEETKVVHKFDTKEQLADFEKLYVAKQATFGRMGVLQAYFAMEQNNLTQIDKQLEDKFGFKMEMDKMYDLDRDNMEIKEVGPIPQPEKAKE